MLAHPGSDPGALGVRRKTGTIRPRHLGASSDGCCPRRSRVAAAMTTRLENTSAGEIVRTIKRQWHRISATATGMVLTLVIVTGFAENQSDATARPRAFGHGAPLSHRSHPDSHGPRRWIRNWTANIDVGDTMGPGNWSDCDCAGTVRTRGIRRVAALLPDTPGRGVAPTFSVLPQDPVGALAQRRITDAAADMHPMHPDRAPEGLHGRRYRSGMDADDRWRSMLPRPSTCPSPHHLRRRPVRTLQPIGCLAAGVAAQLPRRAGRHAPQPGPGITDVTINTDNGPIDLSRPDGRTGRLSRPNGLRNDVPLPCRDLRT